jgi:hypothetical protein
VEKKRIGLPNTAKNSTLGAVGVVVLPSCPETEKRCVGELLDQRFLFFSVLVRE